MLRHLLTGSLLNVSNSQLETVVAAMISAHMAHCPSRDASWQREPLGRNVQITNPEFGGYNRGVFLKRLEGKWGGCPPETDEGTYLGKSV